MAGDLPFWDPGATPTDYTEQPLTVPDAAGTRTVGIQKSEWDRVFLAGVELPGLCQVRGFGRKSRLQRYDVAGNDGATLAHLGYNPAEFEVLCKVWTEQHLRELKSVMEVLEAHAQGPETPGVTAVSVPTTATGDLISTTTTVVKGKGPIVPQPVEIAHPALDLLKIKQCYVAQVSMLEPASEPGAMQMRFVCTEFRPDLVGKKTATMQAAKAIPDTPLDGRYRDAASQFDPAADNSGP